MNACAARSSSSYSTRSADTSMFSRSVIRSTTAELVGTFLLVLVGTSDAVAAGLGRSIAGAAYNSLASALAFGLTLLVAGPVSGGAANPARALGPMIVDLLFTSAWAYVLGPIIGGVLAALFYDRFMRSADAAKDNA